ncbi:MAG: hypothetical protein M0P01_09240 [Treponema sp.]|nr:hypothetical protein [Treponema sp.]
MRPLKKIISTKLLIFSAVSILSVVPVFAGDWNLSAEPLFGVRYGTLGEYVYTPDTNGDYAKLSELDWDMKPQWYYGGKISFGWRGISISGYAEGFIPAAAGSMYDSDWMNITITSDADTKTNYSISENTLISSYKLGADASYTFYLDKYVSVQAIAAIDYMYTNMEARNGYGWYADNYTLGSSVGYSHDSDKAVYYPSGKLSGIDYTREDMFTWIGVTNIITPFRQFTGTLSFFISPYTYIQSLDHHYGKAYYVDIMKGYCSAYKFETSGSYNFTKNILLQLSVSWLFSEIIKGDDYQASSSSGPWVKISNIISGADLNYCEASLALRYSFNF